MKHTGFWILILLAIVMYILPWVINPGTSLTFGAYDLAEWTSLHPDVRNSDMLTALWLRVPLVCLTLIVAFNSKATFSIHWWLSTALAGLLILTALPPFEFLTEARNDPNYQQQFVLFLLAAIGSLMGLSGAARRFHPSVVMFAAIMGIITGSMGVMQARNLMIGFSMPVALGWGMFGFSGVLLVLVFYIRAAQDSTAL